MNKIILIICSSILIASVIVSCKKNPEQSITTNKEQMLSIDGIKKQLESGVSFKKESPFTLRKFDPYLNGEWIGNAVSYGCYREGQAPGQKGPSEVEILEDLNIVKNYWNLIRIYGADDDAELILKIIQQHNLPIRVMVGVWLENEEKHPERNALNVAQVLQGIELANKYTNLVAAVSVGNETQVFWSWHRMNMKNLIPYIRAVRNNTSVPITVADDYNFWNKPESKQVADEIAFIVSHIYPLWNGKTLENAIEWMDTVYFEDVQKMHPEKTIVIGETGWATEYNPDKKGPGEQGTLIKGDVGLVGQEKYLIKLNAWLNEKRITTFLFEAFDEPWKGGGANSPPNEVEKHWGVFYENRTPKESFQNYLNHTQNK